MFDSGSMVPGRKIFSPPMQRRLEKWRGGEGCGLYMCSVKQQSKCGKSMSDMRAINRHCLLFLENILYTEQAKHSSNSWHCTDQYQQYNGLKNTYR